ncbi:acetyl-CoA carboxylase [Streptomyces sp. 2A115]|uniref:acetyl-CoA carboxylase n=1 Tax=Streptomyces sp. 2A115 TaxID=3457439 RepID=UPI003FD4BA02
MTSIAESPVDLPQPGADVPDLGAAVHDIVKKLPGPLRRVMVRVDGCVVEVEWGHDIVPSALAAPVARPGPTAPAAETEIEADADAEPVHSGPSVAAPVVGTFYLRSSPEAAPFVEVGDRIEEGQQVGLIETMKLFTPVTADRAGRVVAVCVDDGEMVEYGQRLFTLDPGN